MRQRWSQTQMGGHMRMSQSHYSKAELGNRRLTFYQLQYLCESEIDVHYVFTGYKCLYKYNKIFDNCSYMQLICYMGIFFSWIDFFYRNNISSKWESMHNRTAYMKYIIAHCEPNDNILYTIRQLQNYTQYKMAEILAVDVKKFRDMENAKIMPDSEILWRMYYLFQIPPAVMLMDEKGLVSEACCLLELLDNNQREDILQLLKTCRNSI